MCTREFRARKRAQRDAANRRAAAEANLPPRAASGAGRFRVGDEVTINGAHYRVTSVDAATGTVRGVPTDWNGPEQTIHERNAREREAMDASTIDRENPEAALAAQDAANVDRVTRERVHAAFEARQLAHREENARRETERLGQAAPTPAEARRAQQEADAVIERVRGMEFTTSDGVAIRASTGTPVIEQGMVYGASNCFCEAEFAEARNVYGLEVFPRRQNTWNTSGWTDSFDQAKRF